MIQCGDGRPRPSKPSAARQLPAGIPDADYQSMRASLEEEAAAIMAEIARLEQAAGQVA